MAVRGVSKRLINYTVPNNLAFVGELLKDKFSPKMDSVACFFPGSVALGLSFLKNTTILEESEYNTFLLMAESLIETCYKSYSQMATGLSPEILWFNLNDTNAADFYINANSASDRRNLLRAETVESLFYLYKLTRNKKYQDYGWEIFRAFENITRHENGYSSINDVTSPVHFGFRDRMESYFTGETLKYLYLLFDDDSSETVDILKWVFNSKAHLISIFNS